MTSHPFDDLVDRLWAAVVVTDTNGTVTGWNRYAEELYGYSRAEALGQPLFDLVIAEPDSAATEMLRMAEGVGYDGLFRMRDKAGRTFQARCRTVAITDEAGEVTAFVGVSFELGYRALTTEEEDRLAAAERTIAQLARLQSITAALVSSANRDDVAAVVIEQGIATLGAAAGTLSIVDGDEIEIVRADGYPPELLDRFHRIRLDADLPIAAAVRTGELVWIVERDAVVDTYPLIQDIAATTGYSSLAAVPLRTDRGVIGCIGLSFRERRAIADDERLFVETLAAQCAQALERARLFREVRDAVALLDTLLWSAPVGLAFFDTDGHYLQVNDRLAQINGVPAEDHIGKTFAEVLTGMGGDVPDAVAQVVANGEPIVDHEVTGETPAAPGVVRHFVVNYYPVRSPEGAIFAVGAAVFEVTEARRAAEERERLLIAESSARSELEASQERLSFLAEASTLLASSLDYEATLRRLAELAVPRLADWCVVFITDDTGTPRPLAAAHVDPVKVEQILEAFIRYPSDPEGPAGVAVAINSGEPAFYPTITEELIEGIAVDEHHLALLRGLALSSGMTVPLLVRGRAIGALSLATEHQRVITPGDLALTEELATRAAQAIENALLYQERSEVARTLQASLLPPRLPDIPGIELGARYVAAGSGAEVGGDFYDAFLTAPNRWLLVIGDVQGKGVHAAAITGLARHTIRSFALVNDDPCDVLRHLNDVLLRADEGVDSRFCTVCVVRVEPHSGGAHLTACSGGHPLPLLLRADGSTARIGAHGSLLGVLGEPDLISVAGDLGRGDALVCVTDGVIERHENQRFLEDEFPALLSDAAGATAPGLAERVEAVARNFVAGEPRDDMAVLVLRVPPA